MTTHGALHRGKYSDPRFSPYGTELAYAVKGQAWKRRAWRPLAAFTLGAGALGWIILR